MIADLQSLQAEALAALEQVANPAALEEWRITYLSRQGRLPALLEKMKDLPKEQRPEAGKAANLAKTAIQSAFDAKKDSFTLSDSGMPDDPTLPGRPFPTGARHPVSRLVDRSIDIFRRMGFALATGPEIDTEFHNFDALNTPADHPARNEQDTFYLDLPPAGNLGRRLLRSHTSTVQIRTMQKEKPPIKIIAPGRCFRRDEVDATHGMFFTQLEALVVDEGITLAHLKGTMECFFRELFGPETRIRFRPHFFPFTEPSFEVDMSVPGLRIKGKEWIEIGGCGMVDPAVFAAVGIDATRYTGFAFGMGLERMVMMIHGIPDLRLLYENDVRFLEQFRTA
ncbi:MAG: phenylalanine--tRNA ligase subunit alpha [Candidatus Methylacidiphilales bacterium]|nr:phenylalanine--tRNA ligase subunit alpha [Candidatus Methylacidiphilales bacterium]